MMHWIELTGDQQDKIKPHVRAAMVGGKSKIYLDSGKRKAELKENQEIGFASEAAFYIWAGAYGSGGFARWDEQRKERDKHPEIGDDGWDCTLFNETKVDVKGSGVNGDVLPIEKAANYHLTQAKDATLSKIAYVQCLALRAKKSDIITIPKKVLLCGWLWGYELENRTDMRGMMGWSARISTIRPLEELVGEPLVVAEAFRMDNWFC